MSGKTAVVWTCCHADPSVNNDRAELLGKFIYDLRPDYVVDLGDTADMRSLSSHDTRYPQRLVSADYQQDIESYLDFQEKLRYKFSKMKRKRPAFYGFEGNHENRIKKALETDPRLEGDKYGISFKHLETSRYYDEYHEYENGAPAIHDYDGVSYAHYFGSGNYGKPMSGEHHAYNLIRKRHHSSTCGHSHKRSIYLKDDAYPKPHIGLVAGCFKGRKESWTGQSNTEWWKGVVVKRNLDDGVYEPEFVSLERLEREYGK